MKVIMTIMTMFDRTTSSIGTLDAWGCHLTEANIRIEAGYEKVQSVYLTSE